MPKNSKKKRKIISDEISESESDTESEKEVDKTKKVKKNESKDEKIDGLLGKREAKVFNKEPVFKMKNKIRKKKAESGIHIFK